MNSCVCRSDELRVRLDETNHKLSYRKWRNQLKKLKRKAERKTLAQLRDASLLEGTGSTESQAAVSGEEENDEEEERQRQLQNELWLERERAAQAMFLAKRDREEKEKQQKEEEQRKLKEEWEERQRKEKEEEEKQKAKQEKRKEGMNHLQKKNADNWQNPPAPPNYNAESQEVKNCPFFQKVGACRFGPNCKRAHNVPDTSTTLLFPGMFLHFELEQSFRDEFDSDLTLEYEEGDIYDEFKLFYEDVFPEFQAVGRVIRFVVCCNYEPHLRGNVYIQYASRDEALSAYEKFNGRWYNKRQLSCQFTTVDNWKSAICGLFHYKKCPKGKHCNFLHVFQNPVNRRNENTSDLSRRRRNGSVQGSEEREPSQRDNRNNWRYEKSSGGSSSRKKHRRSSPLSSTSRQSHRSTSKSPTHSHRKHKKSRSHRDDRSSRSSTHKHSSDGRNSQLSSCKHSGSHNSRSSRHESSRSSCESDESESSGRKYSSSRLHHRGHSPAEDTDSDRHDNKSSKTDSDLENLKIKSHTSFSSKVLEDDGCEKYAYENGCTDRRDKRSKDHSKKCKTKKAKKSKLE